MTLSAAMRARLEFAAKAFLLSSCASVCVAGVVRVHARARAAPENHADLGRWTVLQKPAWCTDDDVRAMRDATALRGWRTPVLDPASGPVVEHALADAPQVRRVLSIRRDLPNAYDAVVELRRPVAALTLPGKPALYVEVDEEGVILTQPSRTRPLREGRPLRVIEGATLPPPRLGARCGKDAIEAASLCADLDASADGDDAGLLSVVDVVDVTNWGGRKKNGESEVVLRISGFVPPTAPVAGAAPVVAEPPPRCVIEWGRIRGPEADDLETTFGTKAGNLIRVLRTYPRLQGLAIVRVAFKDLAVVPGTGPGNGVSRR